MLTNIFKISTNIICNYGGKNYNQNTPNTLQYFPCFQRLICYGQLGFIHALYGCFNAIKSINKIHNIDKLRENMITLINPKKAFRKSNRHS